jgi:hypothetical protein
MQLFDIRARNQPRFSPSSFIADKSCNFAPRTFVGDGCKKWSEIAEIIRATNRTFLRIVLVGIGLLQQTTRSKLC